MIDYTQHLLEIAETTVPVILFLWSNKRKAKKENEVRYHEAKEANERRHQENTDRLDALISEQQYLRPHDHVERDGPLMADGIVWKRSPH